MTKREGLRDYDGIHLPALVQVAVIRTRESGFPLACTPETGRLLMMLASHENAGRIAELGTACGVGAAWIASGMRLGSSLTTVELDPTRAAIAREIFSECRDVDVLTGDWSEVAQYGPFDLLFSDGGPKRNPGDPELLAPLLRPGGLLVLDDYTPESAWTEDQRSRYKDDLSRRIWLENQQWAACELQVAAAMSVILATRLD